MDYVREAAGKWDEVVEAFGVKVFIDPRALLHIVGSTMDFVDDHVRTLRYFSASINGRLFVRGNCDM
jgi:Fe-S cluster assembly iron-binding protein IscA